MGAAASTTDIAASVDASSAADLKAACAGLSAEQKQKIVAALAEEGVSKAVGKMTYFQGLRSRGEVVQIVAAFEGLNMDVELIDFTEWGNRKGTIAPCLPYITQPDGSVMTETGVISKHLATVGGKLVVDDKQDALFEIANGPPIQLADPTYNMPGGAGGGAGANGSNMEEGMKATAEVLKDYVAKLGAGPYFAGEKPGYAEAFVWHNLDNCFAIDKKGFAALLGDEAVDKLQAFYDKFATIDAVKEYLANRPKQWGVPGSLANPAAD